MKILLPLVLTTVALGIISCAPRPHIPASIAPTVPAPTLVAVEKPPGMEETAWQGIVAAARKEGSATLYSFDFTGDVGIAMSKGFHDAYGIGVNVITGRGSEFIARLQTEARTGQRVGDWSEGSPAHLYNMKKSGLTVPLLDLPVLKEKDAFKTSPLVTDPEGHILTWQTSFMWPHLNSKLVKPGDEPRSWFDFLQPRWKGKILFNDPMVSSSPYIIFQPLIKNGVLRPDYLEKLAAQDLIFITGGPMAVERLARGDAPLYIGTQPGEAALAVLAGAPVKIVDMSEGQGVLNKPQVVIKGGPHPNAAKVFANWFLSREGQTVFCRSKGSLSLRKDVPSCLPSSLTMEVARPIPTTVDDLNEQSKLFTDRAWVPILRGRN